MGDHTLMIGNVYYDDFFKHKDLLCEYDDITIKHYGHGLGLFHERNKIAWFAKYENPNMTEEQAQQIAMSSCYNDLRFWNDSVNADPNGIKKFTGEHPEIIKSHPLYNVKIIKD